MKTEHIIPPHPIYIVSTWVSDEWKGDNTDEENICHTINLVFLIRHESRLAIMEEYYTHSYKYLILNDSGMVEDYFGNLPYPRKVNEYYSAVPVLPGEDKEKLIQTAKKDNLWSLEFRIKETSKEKNKRTTIQNEITAR